MAGRYFHSWNIQRCYKILKCFSMLSRAYFVVGQVEKAIDPFIEAMRVSNPALERITFRDTEGVEHVIAMCDALGRLSF